jgi:hypothetical protein
MSFAAIANAKAYRTFTSPGAHVEETKKRTTWQTLEPANACICEIGCKHAVDSY